MFYKYILFYSLAVTVLKNAHTNGKNLDNPLPDNKF